MLMFGLVNNIVGCPPSIYSVTLQSSTVHEKGQKSISGAFSVVKCCGALFLYNLQPRSFAKVQKKYVLRIGLELATFGLEEDAVPTLKPISRCVSPKYICV